MDEHLDIYLRAVDAGVERERLGELVDTCAEPIIRRTVSARLSGRWEDMDDVCSEARLELLLHLRRIKATPGAKAIEDFAAYVGTLARNTCHHYFRRRRSGRMRLAKQIRFLLDEPEFKTWQRQGTTWCGLAEWREDRPPALPQEFAGPWEGRRDLAALLKQVFETAGGAIEFEALVDLVAGVWRIPPDAEAYPADVDLESIPAVTQGAEISIDRRRYAERLWQEIRQLPRRQRVALLLNLRDGRGNSILSMFPLSGVASFEETAAVLEMSESQLAEVWIELPWDDNTMAQFLGCTRQQVINLRMSARKRLVNRLGDRPV